MVTADVKAKHGGGDPERDAHQPIEHDHHKLRGLTDPHLWFAYRIGVLSKLQLRDNGYTPSTLADFFEKSVQPGT